MSKIEVPRQIRTEDFPTEYQGLVAKLSMLLTPFMNSVYYVLDGRVDYVNLNRQIISVRVITDAAGNMTNPPVIQISDKINKVSGVVVLSANNLINPNTYLTSAPFVHFRQFEKKVSIQYITGLAPNTEYSFTFEVIGN